MIPNFARIAVTILILSSVPMNAEVYMRQMNPKSPLDGKILQTVHLIDKHPDDPALHNDLGVLLQERRFPKDAMREFQKAVDLDETFYPAWFNLGLTYEKMGRKYKAWRCFKKTLKFRAGHDLAEYHLGEIYESWGLHRKAIRHWAKAYKINPKILSIAYNPSIINNKHIEEIMDAYYRRYKGSVNQPFQMTPEKMKTVYPEEKPAKEKNKAKKAVKHPRKPASARPTRPKRPQTPPTPR